MRYIKYYEDSTSINSICKIYGIENYKINTDETVDVNGNVYLITKGLSKLPLKFGKVSGNFYISGNRLSSLEGCPTHIGGRFDCSDNQLISLRGCPNYVGGNFSCRYNQLTNLEGFPISVGNRQDIPGNGGELRDGSFSDFDCHNNPIYEIWKLFEDLDKMELFNDYDIVRGDSIVLDRLNEFLEVIGKPTVRKVEGYKNI